MCQEALSDLKMAIRAAGEHKQRITMNIAIDGLRLRDEKTGVRNSSKESYVQRQLTYIAYFSIKWSLQGVMSHITCVYACLSASRKSPHRHRIQYV